MKHLQISNNADPPIESHRLSEDLDSSCSTPYVSAPSSPGRNPSGYFFSAPASPMHYVLSSSKTTSFCDDNIELVKEASFEFEFEISSRFSQANNDAASENIGSMTSADELFLNGQIRPMKLSSHLQRPQFLAPLIDLDDGEGDDVSTVEITRGRDLRSRNRSMHRKARSLSPFRAHEYSREVMRNNDECNINEEIEIEVDEVEAPSVETTPSVSASSSRSSSSGRNSKKWIFLKDLLYRSKSEGRGHGKEKFWSNLSFSQSAREKKLVSPSLTPSSSRDENTKDKKQLVSPSLTPSSSRDEKEKEKGRNTKDKKLVSPSLTPSSSRDEKEKGRNVKGRKQAVAKKSGGKPANGVSKRRVALSAHELHYTANRAQAEEMKKKTSLPYRQGLFGCLSFSSKSYGAFSVFTRSLNPVSSR